MLYGVYCTCDQFKQQSEKSLNHKIDQDNGAPLWAAVASFCCWKLWMFDLASLYQQQSGCVVGFSAASNIWMESKPLDNLPAYFLANKFVWAGGVIF